MKAKKLDRNLIKSLIYRKKYDKIGLSHICGDVFGVAQN